MKKRSLIRALTGAVFLIAGLTTAQAGYGQDMSCNDFCGPRAMAVYEEHGQRAATWYYSGCMDGCLNP